MTTKNSEEWYLFLLGQIFGDYKVVDCVGEGGFALVLKALHAKTGKEVAIKVLLPTGNLQSRFDFENEGELFSRLGGCSSVVTLIKSDEFLFSEKSQAGHSMSFSMPYHVLELAQGNLEVLVLERDRMAWTERLQLWRDVVLGVHQMHLLEIVHRDLKSENCLLFVRQKNHTDCKVSDFGRSRHLPSLPRHTPEQYVVGLGDIRFAPPEFLAWQGDDSKDGHISADLYGLGSILFELATGQPITAFSLGYGPDIKERNLQLLRAGKKVDLSGMRSSYEPAFRLFESSCPPVIRQQAGALLRQLCDPVPSMRVPKKKLSQKSIEPGLHWLLTRADIFSRTVDANSKIKTKVKASNAINASSYVSIRGGA